MLSGPYNKNDVDGGDPGSLASLSQVEREGGEFYDKKYKTKCSGYWREGFVMVQRAVDIAMRDYFEGEKTNPLAAEDAIQVHLQLGRRERHGNFD